MLIEDLRVTIRHFFMTITARIVILVTVQMKKKKKVPHDLCRNLTYAARVLNWFEFRAKNKWKNSI